MLYRFITNLLDVVPNKGELPVLRILKVPQDFSHTRIAHVINVYSSGLVSTPLAGRYGELEPGVYVAFIGEHRGSEALSAELRTAFRRYLESLSQRRECTTVGDQEELNRGVNELVDKLVSNVEELRIPSTAYVVANLLSNFLEKAIPKEFKCREKGVRVCIQLDVAFLKEALRERERELEPLFGFCREHPNLCGEEVDACSKFFKVVKQFHIRFQHGIADGRERIYLIFYSCYRRLNYLRVSSIIQFLLDEGKNPADYLRDVFVNLSAEQGTESCEVKDLIMESEDTYVIELLCSTGRVSRRLGADELDKYRLRVNPTYRSSRRLIEKLCKEFDEHRKLSQLTPARYFSILKNDLKVFKEIVSRYAGKEMTLGGVAYTIGEDLVKV